MKKQPFWTIIFACLFYFLSFSLLQAKEKCPETATMGQNEEECCCTCVNGQAQKEASLDDTETEETDEESNVRSV